MTRLHLSVLLFAFATGCASSDPLAGTWSNATCYGSDSTPEDVENCSTALTFTDELEVELRAEWTSLPATANYPGCITTKLVTGMTWSTARSGDHEVLTVEGTGVATMGRSGCVNATDDLEPSTTSTIDLPSGDIDYQITDGALTILTGDLVGIYE
jgi:hypothetical protein